MCVCVCVCVRERVRACASMLRLHPEPQARMSRSPLKGAGVWACAQGDVALLGWAHRITHTAGRQEAYETCAGLVPFSGCTPAPGCPAGPSTSHFSLEGPLLWRSQQQQHQQPEARAVQPELPTKAPPSPLALPNSAAPGAHRPVAARVETEGGGRAEGAAVGSKSHAANARFVLGPQASTQSGVANGSVVAGAGGAAAVGSQRPRNSGGGSTGDEKGVKAGPSTLPPMLQRTCSNGSSGAAAVAPSLDGGSSPTEQQQQQLRQLQHVDCSDGRCSPMALVPGEE